MRLKGTRPHSYLSPLLRTEKSSWEIHFAFSLIISHLGVTRMHPGCQLLHPFSFNCLIRGAAQTAAQYVRCAQVNILERYITVTWLCDSDYELCNQLQSSLLNSNLFFSANSLDDAVFYCRYFALWRHKMLLEFCLNCVSETANRRFTSLLISNWKSTTFQAMEWLPTRASANFALGSCERVISSKASELSTLVPDSQVTEIRLSRTKKYSFWTKTETETHSHGVLQLCITVWQIIFSCSSMRCSPFEDIWNELLRPLTQFQYLLRRLLDNAMILLEALSLSVK